MEWNVSRARFPLTKENKDKRCKLGDVIPNLWILSVDGIEKAKIFSVYYKSIDEVKIHIVGKYYSDKITKPMIFKAVKELEQSLIGDNYNRKVNNYVKKKERKKVEKIIAI